MHGVTTMVATRSRAATAATEARKASAIDQDGWNARKQVALLANGQQLAWVEMGDQDAPPLILLHGYTDTSRAWSLLAPRLALTHRLYIVDLRGHGASSVPACCYTLADYVHDIVLFMDVRGIERAAFAGHSFGSLIGQRLAADYPDRVERLILAGSSAGVIVERGDPLWEGVRELREPLDPERDPFLEAWVAQFELPAIDPHFAYHARAECLALPVIVWRGVMDTLAGSSTARFAERIDAPVLILAGGRDELTGAEHQAALREALPHARYREYAELDHNLIYEGPDRILPAIRDFLAG